MEGGAARGSKMDEREEARSDVVFIYSYVRGTV